MSRNKMADRHREGERTELRGTWGSDDVVALSGRRVESVDKRALNVCNEWSMRS